MLMKYTHLKNHRRNLISILIIGLFFGFTLNLLCNTVSASTDTTLSGNPPSVNSISPNNGALNSVVTLTITGSNFQSGATVELIQPGYAPVFGTGVSVSSSQITGSFNLNGLTIGLVDVEVTNPDGQKIILPNAFAIGPIQTTATTTLLTTQVTQSPTTTPTTPQTTITIVTSQPTETINYSATIAVMQSQIAQQNAKIAEQGSWIDIILKFLGLK